MTTLSTLILILFLSSAAGADAKSPRIASDNLISRKAETNLAHGAETRYTKRWDAHGRMKKERGLPSHGEIRLDDRSPFSSE